MAFLHRLAQTKPSHSLTKSAEKSESATMGNDLVYVYDPDTHNEVASGAVWLFIVLQTSKFC